MPHYLESRFKIPYTKQELKVCKYMKRFFAWAGILIIAAVFLALIVLTFTGGPENVILALLFCVIVIPVMLYGYALILKYVRNRNKRDN